MLEIVEAIIGLELCEQSCTKRAALCQGKIHASEAARSAAELARYQGKNYTPHDLSTPPPVISDGNLNCTGNITAANPNCWRNTCWQ